MPGQVPTFSADDEDEVDLFYQEFFLIEEPELEQEESPVAHLADTLDLEGLFGVDPALPSIISTALSSKQHLIIHGPPGTGKTTLARMIAEALGEDWVILTATSDWTSHELIGGYMPESSGVLKFLPGAILANLDKVTIIDEFNRADIDKAFGPLFSILSGQPVILPYRADPSNPDSPLVEILPRPVETLASSQWAPTTNWRLICTLNTYDKASLFQMSYALARRFAWVHLDVPWDLPGFVAEYAAQQGWEPHPLIEIAAHQDAAPAARVWAAISEVRPLGPAPIIDVMETTRLLSTSRTRDNSGAMDWRLALVQALGMFVVPLMEGVEQQQAQTLAERIQDVLSPGPEDQRLRDAVRALRSQMVFQSV